MVVGLMLKCSRCQVGTQLRTEELHPIALVRLSVDSHPDQVHVVGHENIRWAEQTLTRRRMAHNFAKGSMETVGQPAFGSTRHRQRPEDDGVGLVEFTAESWQVVREG